MPSITETVELVGAPPVRAARAGSRAAIRFARGWVWAIIPSLVWCYLAWQRRWITDDGLIAARTVRQILAGNGPVFNAGERVEANTSTLWTWLLAAGSWLSGANVYAVMIWAGVVLAPLGLLFALLGARRLHGGAALGKPLVPVGALVVLALPPFWDFATSGLEESLIFCWLGLTWWLLTGLSLDTSSAWRAYVLAFTAGLGWLVRPDMALATVCFLAAMFIAVRPGLRRSAALLGVAAAVPLGYQLFRMGYYGMLVPNTAIAKEASATNITLGMRYLGNFLSPYHLWVPALIIAALTPFAVRWRRLDTPARAAIIAAVVSALAMTAYVVAIGGDFMHARMLLPGTFTLLLPVMAVPVPSRAALMEKSGSIARQVTVVLVGTALVASWAVVCGMQWRLPQTPGIIPKTGITDERAFWTVRVSSAHPTSATPYVGAIIGPPSLTGGLGWILARDESAKQPVLLFTPTASSALVAVPLDRTGASIAIPGAILGTLGAAVPLNGIVIDTHGLSYALGSHFEPGAHGRVGHDKNASPLWVAADYTSAASIPGISPTQLADARRALSCGEIAQLKVATQAPLTWDQFWDNVADAFTLSRMRIPNNPATAVVEYCR